MFSLLISRLLIVCSSRFWYAPRRLRTSDTYLIAPLTSVIASLLLSSVDTSVCSMPRRFREIVGIRIASCCPSLAPICVSMAPIPVISKTIPLQSTLPGNAVGGFTWIVSSNPWPPLIVTLSCPTVATSASSGKPSPACRPKEAFVWSRSISPSSL